MTPFLITAQPRPACSALYRKGMALRTSRGAGWVWRSVAQRGSGVLDPCLGETVGVDVSWRVPDQGVEDRVVGQ